MNIMQRKRDALAGPTRERRRFPGRAWTLLWVLCALPLRAAGPPESHAPAASLAGLTAQADLVALVQTRDTDYLERREIPVGGSAYLKVLIPYKTDRPVDLVQVYEKGLHAGECYFPDPAVFEEGRRYLVFLRHDPQDASRDLGLPEGCALEVLVRSDNRYALRFPPTGIRLTDDLSGLAEAMEFSDPYAIVTDDSMPSALRDRLRDSGDIVPYVQADADAEVEARKWLPPSEAGSELWRYTRGIPLGELRPLLGLVQQTSR